MHGAAFTAWVLLLLTQSTLVAAHRTDIHRKLGWIGAALAVFMAGIAVRTALVAVHAAVVCCNADAARGFLIIPSRTIPSCAGILPARTPGACRW